MSISSKGHKKHFAELFRFIGAGMNQLKWLKLKKKKKSPKEKIIFVQYEGNSIADMY